MMPAILSRKIDTGCLFALITVLISTLPLCGCSQEKSITFKTAGMTHTISEGSSGVPSDLKKFVYPKAFIAGSTSARDKDGEHARFLSMSSGDSLKKVSAWYAATLKRTGWTIDSQDAINRLVNISGHREGLEINVLMAEDGDKTTISVSKGRAFEDDVDLDELDKFTPDSLTAPMN